MNLSTQGCMVVLEIQNTGAIAISDYDNTDVIVTMDTFQQNLEARRFQYSDPLAANSWHLDIDADVFPYEPSTLNPGESGTLTVHWHLPAQVPPPPLGYGEARAVTIGAANGATTNFAPPRGNLMVPC